MSTVAHPRITPEELLKLPDGDRYELVDGELIETQMSGESVWVGGKIYGRMDAYCEANGLGWVFPDGFQFQCFPDDDERVRVPDAAFIAKGRLPVEQFEGGFCRIAPDLAVEVVSPNDRFYEVDRKANEYLRAGVSLVWVLNPDTQTIFVYRPDGSMSHLTLDHVLSGETVLPGFECPVRSLFPNKTQLGLTAT